MKSFNEWLGGLGGGGGEDRELLRILGKYRKTKELTDEELAYCDAAYLKKYPAMKATLEVLRASGKRTPQFDPAVLGR